MRAVAFLLLSVTTLSLLGGCAAPAPPQQMCTMMGCEDGLGVVVEGTPVGAYRIEARAAGGETQVRECASPQACGLVFFAGFLPEEVTVEVIAGGERSSRTARPLVESVQPNGPDCPPTCRQARVTVPWPGA